MKEKIKSFCSKYYVNVLNDTQRFFRTSPPKNFHISDLNSYQEIAEVISEPLLTITIPQSKLETLINLENVFFNNIEDVYARRMFETWMSEQQNEKRLRQKYPSAQSAYEQYQVVLNLCRENPKRIKDLD